jgi:hypothetical protein
MESVFQSCRYVVENGRECAAASGVGDGRCENNCKPPQAAGVKSLGRERCGKGARRHQVRTVEGEHQ